ncbi:MAG: hypothetical protein JSR58_01660 [Verrucomicrobia bacterium]|nr:hypothetical protein [Verrucomicrobiota bacterium]
MNKWFFSLFFPLLVFAEPRVEIVAPFHNPMHQECERLSKTLEEKGFPATVVPTNLSHYWGLKKREGRLGKLQRKFSLDFPYQIEPDKDVAKIVFWNITHYFRQRHSLEKLPKEKMVLFQWEPPSLLRKMFSKKMEKYFARIYTWNDDVIDNKTYFKFYYPVLRPMIVDLPSFEEKKFCTLVAGNPPSKFYRKPGQLYSERLKAIEFFENAHEQGFELYGRSWDKEKHSSYRGIAGDKIQTIKNYRFVICYENTGTSNGYVTEKIFDCFAAGVVPVYLGAPNIEKYVPKNCFIDRRDFASMEDLYALMKNMTKKQYDEYVSNIREYLTSEKAHLFSRENFDQIFYEAVIFP